MAKFEFVNMSGDCLEVEASDVEVAREVATKKLTKYPQEVVFTVEEVEQKWKAHFPDGSLDVVEVVGFERDEVFGQYDIAGYDLLCVQRAGGGITVL